MEIINKDQFLTEIMQNRSINNAADQGEIENTAEEVSATVHTVIDETFFDHSLWDCIPRPNDRNNHSLIRDPYRGEQIILTGQKCTLNCIVELHHDDLGNLISKSYYPVTESLTLNTMTLGVRKVCFHGCYSTITGKAFILPQVLKGDGDEDYSLEISHEAALNQEPGASFNVAIVRETGLYLGQVHPEYEIEPLNWPEFKDNLEEDLSGNIIYCEDTEPYPSLRDAYELHYGILGDEPIPQLSFPL